MNWRELRDKINTLDENNLEDDVTVYLYGYDEYFPAEEVIISKDKDVLDEGCLYITIHTGALE